MKTKKDYEQEINRLCENYSKRIFSLKGQMNSLLIEFADEYNKIWRKE
jgi:hypothetical protein